jgi:hypothetical protein
MPELNSTQLLEQARKETGLQDIGEEFFLGFQRLVSSIDNETPLSVIGLPAARQRMLRLLTNQLRFQADLKAHPEILEQELLPPVFVSGLPRVGSTKLHRLLAESGDFQAMLFWQGFNHAPFPDAKTNEPDPRIEDAVAYIKWRSMQNPATLAGHYVEASEYEEETYLLEYTFSTYWPTSYFEVPSYLAELKTVDHDSAYLYLRQALQYLQWQFHRDHSRPWVLKSPLNLGYEASIVKNFPEAKFLMLHRDPVTVIPSLAALAGQMRKLYCATVPAESNIARWALAEYSESVDRMLAWRDGVHQTDIMDIAYADVQDHDLKTIRDVYIFLGRELSASAERKISDWLGINRQHQHGVHHYSLESSGLSEGDINEKFSSYKTRFGGYLR